MHCGPAKLKATAEAVYNPWHVGVALRFQSISKYFVFALRLLNIGTIGSTHVPYRSSLAVSRKEYRLDLESLAPY